MSTASKSTTATSHRLARLPLGLAITFTCLLAGLAPAAKADFTTIGSPLSVPATLSTAENLNYEGTYTPVPPAPVNP